MSIGKYNELEEICSALSVFITEARKEAAVIRAYQNVIEETEGYNEFLNISHDSIWRELLIEIAKIFDSSGNGLNENCSIKRLRAECLKNAYVHIFPNGEEEFSIQLLDVTQQFYDNLPLKKSRNKQLSHHDMKQIRGETPIQISFDDIEKLLVLTTKCFEWIYSLVSCSEVSLGNYGEYVEKYEESLKELIDKQS